MVEQKELFVENKQIDMKGSIYDPNNQRKNLIVERGAKSCGEKFTPFILLIGLGAHSIFEGIAVGIEG